MSYLMGRLIMGCLGAIILGGGGMLVAGPVGAIIGLLIAILASMGGKRR
mgnify:CR=1 FL=1